MPIDPVKLLAGKFSEDVVDFILEQCRIPTSGSGRYSEYVNVAKVVIAFIKGELRPFLMSHSQELLRMGTHMDVINAFMNYPVDFLNAHPFTLPHLTRAIGYSIMYPLFYYHVTGNNFALDCASGSMSRMLENLDGGDFVRNGGLSSLNYFATSVFEQVPEIRYLYKRAPYPW